MKKAKRLERSVINAVTVFLLIYSILIGMSGPISAKETAVLVEIFYLPHQPAEAVVRDIEGIVGGFAGVKVKKYSFEDPANRKLLEKYGLKEHTPVAVFIDGKNEFIIEGRRFSLKNFPKGNAFVPMFEGSWTYQDIEAILETAIQEH